LTKEKDLHSITIPNDVLNHKNLSVGAKLLYGEIAYWCKQNGCCRLRNEQLSILCNVSKPTIIKWIKELKKNHFIKCKIRKRYIRVIFLWKTNKNQIQTVLKNLTEGVKNLNDISKDISETSFSDDDVSVNNNFVEDDLKIETKEWVNKKGQKVGIDTIDYEDEDE